MEFRIRVISTGDRDQYIDGMLNILWANGSSSYCVFESRESPEAEWKTIQIIK